MTWSMFEFASLIFFGLALAFVLIAIVLFFVWRIPSIYADIKGKTVVHDVARTRNQHGRNQNLHSRYDQQDMNMGSRRDFQSAEEMVTRVRTRVETHVSYQNDNADGDVPTSISYLSTSLTEND